MNRCINLLNVEKIHPPIHMPRSSARFKTQGANTPHVGAFKNPFVGIEINLFKEIQDIESIHKPTSSRKKTVLLNALEDIANLDYGFQNQVFYALSQLRPKDDDDDKDKNIFKITAGKDLQNIKAECSELLQTKEKSGKCIADLQSKLKMIEEEKQQRLADITFMKEKLRFQNSRFSNFVNTKNEIEILQQAYDKIFETYDFDNEDPKITDLIRENDRLRTNLMKLRTEWDITMQITKRLRLQEQTDY